MVLGACWLSRVTVLSKHPRVNASARRETCTKHSLSRSLSHTRKMRGHAHVRLEASPQAAFPSIIRVFYAQIHPQFPVGARAALIPLSFSVGGGGRGGGMDFILLHARSSHLHVSLFNRIFAAEDM